MDGKDGEKLKRMSGNKRKNNCISFIFLFYLLIIVFIVYISFPPFLSPSISSLPILPFFVSLFLHSSLFLRSHFIRLYSLTLSFYFCSYYYFFPHPRFPFSPLLYSIYSLSFYLSSVVSLLALFSFLPFCSIYLFSHLPQLFLFFVLLSIFLLHPLHFSAFCYQYSTFSFISPFSLLFLFLSNLSV